MANPIAVPGTVVPASSGVSPGGAQGLTGPVQVSADTGNIAQLGSDGLVLVPQSQIWSVRLRSYNSLAWGNPNFEIDQANVGTVLTNPASGTRLVDRWFVGRSAGLTGTVNTQKAAIAFGSGIVVPGTSYAITQGALNVVVGTAQASLAAGDYWYFFQNVEGPMMRELQQDVHSLTLLVKSSVAGLKFSVSLRDNPNTYTLVKLCTIPSANTYTLITLPSLPIWTASSSNWSVAPGTIGYQIGICLASGTTLTTATTDVWTAGNYIAASGMSNLLATAGASFTAALIQHEPGGICSQLMDLDFDTNLWRCLRYLDKSYDYAIKPGTINDNGRVSFWAAGATTAGIAPVTFSRRMAKVPTITIYNPVTGAVNSVRDGNVTDHGSATGATWTGEHGMNRVDFATATTGATQIYAHYVADTGW